MKKIILSATAVIVVIGLGVGVVWYHDLYKQEQEKTSQAREEIKKFEKIVEANEKNTDQELTNVATNFITLIFNKSENDDATNQAELLRITTGNVYSRLTQDAKEPVWGDMEGLEGFNSEAHIIESFYNRTNNTKGQVKVQFEQWLSKGGLTDKTVNEAIIQLEYVEDQWKVYQFEIKPIV
jgi:hypothetical protein